MASTDLPATLVQQIACNVLNVDASAIPLEVVEHTKALILDSIGCALAATEEPAFTRASRVLAQLGGNPDCTVIGSSQRVNLPQAVLLNGILIRSLDLNDAYIGPRQMGHPSDNIAVALSVGEKFRASGLSVMRCATTGATSAFTSSGVMKSRPSSAAVARLASSSASDARGPAPICTASSRRVRETSS